MSTKHTATLPNGQVITRTSAHRVYPFVVAYRTPERKADPSGWYVAGWTSRHDLAENLASTKRRQFPAAEIEILSTVISR